MLSNDVEHYLEWPRFEQNKIHMHHAGRFKQTDEHGVEHYINYADRSANECEHALLSLAK